MAYRFAFVVHPLSKEDYQRAKGFAWTRIVPEFLLNLCIPYFSPRILGNFSTTSMGTGEKVEGILMGIPETGKMLLKLPPEHTYRKLEYLGHYAEQMGARVMGLGAYTSVVGDGGKTLAQRLEIGLTNGNALTSYILHQQTKELASMLELSVNQAEMIIVGATGSIGSALAFSLSSEAGGLHLISRNQERLELLKLKLVRQSRNPLYIYTISDSIPWEKADIIITAATTVRSTVPLNQCSPGTVIVDVGQPPNIPKSLAERKKDVLVVQGGEVLWTSPIQTSFPLPLPERQLYGCLGETLLLALEEWEGDFALGKEWNGVKVQKVREWAEKHQVKPAPLCSYDGPVDPEVWKQIRKQRIERKR